MSAAVTLNTYESFYGANRLAASSEQFLDVFKETASAQPKELLKTLVRAAHNTPKMVMYLEEDSNGHRTVHWAHRLTNFDCALGSPSKWDDQVFAFTGDVHLGQVQALLIPNDLFHRTNTALKVPKVEDVTALVTMMLANNDPGLGPVDENDEGDKIKTRKAMTVPPQYVPLVMERDSYTPAQLWMHVFPQIQNDNAIEECQIWIDWMRTALTRSDNGTSPLNGLKVSPPIVDRTLRERMQQWLEADLPELKAAGQPDALGGIITSLQDQTSALEQLASTMAKQVSADTTARLLASEPKTFAQLNIVAQPLLNLCRVHDEAQLPGFWKKLFNAKKCQQSAVLDHALCNQAKCGNGMAPEATPKLVQMCRELKLTAVNTSNLTEGISIFDIQVTRRAKEEAREKNSIYNVLYANDVSSPSYNEVQQLVKWAPAFPLTVLQFINQVNGFVTLLFVLCGEASVEPLAVQDWLNSARTELERLEDLEPRQLRSVLARLLVTLHVRLAKHFSRLLQGEQASPPKLQFLLDVLEGENYVTLNNVPRQYLEETPASPPSKKQGGAGAEKKKNAEKNGDANPTGATNTAHVVSSLVDRFVKSGKTVREILSTDGIQQPFIEGQSSGRHNQICLHYHLNKACHCSKSCYRVGSHRALTAAEVEGVDRLLTAVGCPAL